MNFDDTADDVEAFVRHFDTTRVAVALAGQPVEIDASLDAVRLARALYQISQKALAWCCCVAALRTRRCGTREIAVATMFIIIVVFIFFIIIVMVMMMMCRIV